MRYSSYINNVQSKQWGLDIKEAYLFSWMYEIPSWASKISIEGSDYFFASKTKAVEELPLLTDKKDTMYRYYKSLEKKGLIEIKKVDNKDYVKLTAKAKTWNKWPSDRSDKNPNTLGNKSEQPSDKNPTYNNTIYDNSIRDNKEGDPVFQNFLEQYYELSSKPQTSKNRLSSEREWAKLAPTDKYQASEKIKEFVEYRKQTQEEQFGSWESKFIPAPENYLKDRLWEELPNKVYVYAEEYHGVHGSGHRWRYSANDKPALIGQKRVYWERKEGKKNRAYVYE